MKANSSLKKSQYFDAWLSRNHKVIPLYIFRKWRPFLQQKGVHLFHWYTGDSCFFKGEMRLLGIFIPAAYKTQSCKLYSLPAVCHQQSIFQNERALYMPRWWYPPMNRRRYFPPSNGRILCSLSNLYGKRNWQSQKLAICFWLRGQVIDGPGYTFISELHKADDLSLPEWSRSPGNELRRRVQEKKLRGLPVVVPQSCIYSGGVGTPRCCHCLIVLLSWQCSGIFK